MVSLLYLWFKFLKIGLFAFGGGWAVLSLIKKELVAPGILSEEEFLKLVSIAGATPGPVAVNAATYVGTKLFGPLGGVLLTLAVILPPIFFVTTVVYLLGKIKPSLLRPLLLAIRAGVAGLILASFFSILPGNLEVVPFLLSAITSFLSITYLGLHPALGLFIGAFLFPAFKVLIPG